LAARRALYLASGELDRILIAKARLFTARGALEIHGNIRWKKKETQPVYRTTDAGQRQGFQAIRGSLVDA